MDKLVTIKYRTDCQWWFWNSTRVTHCALLYATIHLEVEMKVRTVCRRLDLAFILQQKFLFPDYESLRSKDSLLHLQLRTNRIRSGARLSPRSLRLRGKLEYADSYRSPRCESSGPKPHSPGNCHRVKNWPSWSQTRGLPFRTSSARYWCSRDEPTDLLNTWLATARCVKTRRMSPNQVVNQWSRAQSFRRSIFEVSCLWNSLG